MIMKVVLVEVVAVVVEVKVLIVVQGSSHSDRDDNAETRRPDADTGATKSARRTMTREVLVVKMPSRGRRSRSIDNGNSGTDRDDSAKPNQHTQRRNMNSAAAPATC